MKGNEEVRLLAIGEGDALRQRQQIVRRPGERNVRIQLLLKRLFNLARDLEAERFLRHSIRAERALLKAPVPWIDDDARSGAGKRRRSGEACERSEDPRVLTRKHSVANGNNRAKAANRNPAPCIRGRLREMREDLPLEMN